MEGKSKDIEINVNGDEFTFKSGWGEKKFPLNKAIDEPMGSQNVKVNK